MLPYEESNRAAHRSAQKTVQWTLFLARGRFPYGSGEKPFSTTTKSTCFLVRQVLFLLFCFFVRLCTGIEQPVRPRRSRRSRPGGTVLRTVPQGAGDFPYGSGKGRHPREIIPTQAKKRKLEDGMPTFFNYFGKNVRRELRISAELLFLY